MEKSIYSPESIALSSLLRRIRREEKLTQVEVARRLGRTQSYLSKIEQGELMVDAVGLFILCRALGISFSEFAARLDSEWAKLPSDKAVNDRENS